MSGSKETLILDTVKTIWNFHQLEAKSDYTSYQLISDLLDEYFSSHDKLEFFAKYLINDTYKDSNEEA